MYSIGGSIRTLSVSLLAVAAIAASLVLANSTQRTSSGGIPAGENGPGEPSLDRIREAGL